MLFCVCLRFLKRKIRKFKNWKKCQKSYQTHSKITDKKKGKQNGAPKTETFQNLHSLWVKSITRVFQWSEEETRRQFSSQFWTSSVRGLSGWSWKDGMVTCYSKRDQRRLVGCGIRSVWVSAQKIHLHVQNAELHVQNINLHVQYKPLLLHNHYFNKGYPNRNNGPRKCFHKRWVITRRKWVSRAANP